MTRVVEDDSRWQRTLFYSIHTQRDYALAGREDTSFDKATGIFSVRVNLSYTNTPTTYEYINDSVHVTYQWRDRIKLIKIYTVTGGSPQTMDYTIVHNDESDDTYDPENSTLLNEVRDTIKNNNILQDSSHVKNK